ncbi:hypothetical protein AB1K18_09165 [Peribacillus simplex]|uniref:hypothetical protein n=1 Tax=Peribacillus simplex TaxID=1478 RepID=UPI003B8CE3B0
MLSGTIVIGHITLKTEWEVIYGGALLIIGIVLLMKMQIWFPKSRELIIEVPSVLINDGVMMLDEMKKLD